MMKFNDLENDYLTKLNNLTSLNNKIEFLVSLNESFVNENKILENKIDVANKSREILIQISETFTDETIKYIENLVTSALQTVFEKNVAFKLEHKKSSKTKTLRAYLIENKQEYSLEDSRGGGLCAVISLILLIIFRKFNNVKFPLLLDESLSFLNSIDNLYTERCFEFINKICSEGSENLLLITGKNIESANKNASQLLKI